MVALKRFAVVEHIVEGNGTLTAARQDGSGGGALTVRFFPAPGDGRVFFVLQRLPTSTEPDDEPVGPGPGPGGVIIEDHVIGAADSDVVGVDGVADLDVVFLRPALPRPGIGLGDNDFVVEEPQPPPLPPQEVARIRIEVGPEGGSLRETEGQHAGFTVPGTFGSTEPFSDGLDPVTGDVVLESGRNVGQPAAAPTPERQWICRITNVSDRDLKAFARVFFRVRRTVSITRVPLDRLASVFQGALRAITPTVAVVGGDLVISIPREFGDEFDIEPERIDLPVDVGNATVDMVPVELTFIRAERMYREAYEALKRQIDAAPLVSADDDFVDKMVTAAMQGGPGDLIQRAADLAHGADGFVRQLYRNLGIPEVNPNVGTTSTNVRHEDDLVIRTTLNVDRLSASGEAAIAAFDVLLDVIAARLDVQIGTQRFFRRHPLADLPQGDPDRLRHLNEFTTRTELTFASRFTFSIADLDADVELGGGFIGEIAEAVVDWVIDRFEWLFEDAVEDLVREKVRSYLNTNAKALAAVTRAAMIEIAQRGHELHTLSRDDRDLVIEHFDPLGTEVPRFPRRRRRPLGEPIDGPVPDDAAARLAGIEHIVVVMMENRSFDHMLGFLSHPSERPATGRRTDIDGLTGDERLPLGPDVSGPGQAPTFAPQLEWRPDPDHSFNGALLQIGAGAMDGFVPSFRGRVANAPQIDTQGPLADERRIAACQPADRMPLHAHLAEEYCVLDRWFSSFPGATFPNRMCELAGVTRARTNSELIPALGYLDELTLFDLLDRRRIDWRLYEGDVSFLRTFDRYRLDFTHLRPWAEFRDGGSAPLASVTFIDPNVTGLPSEDHANDDHPPTDVAFGQEFLRQVLQRLRASQSWPRTMLIVAYDEHGGFFDHVAPPGTARFHNANPDVDAELPKVHPNALTYGVRVPAFVVSPRVRHRATGHRIYDHTTIIRTILERFAPDQIEFMPERVRRARHLGEILTTSPRAVVADPPRLTRLDRRRVRMDRFEPGLDLSRRDRDTDDFRVIMSSLGAPRI